MRIVSIAINIGITFLFPMSKNKDWTASTSKSTSTSSQTQIRALAPSLLSQDDADETAGTRGTSMNTSVSGVMSSNCTSSTTTASTTASTSTSTTTTASTSSNTHMNILMIRHGRSLGNEMMDRPGNRWGDPHFKDDATLRDAPLSDRGIQQAIALGVADTDASISKPTTTTSSSSSSSTTTTTSSTIPQHQIDKLQLVVVSPLTRALQTMQHALRHRLPAHIPILVHPLLTERVYTLSDTGRRVHELKADFGDDDARINFDLLLLRDDCDEDWWFHHITNNNNHDNKDKDNDNNDVNMDYKEWRPCDAHQWYATPGEPHHVFDARMQRLQDWLSQRPEQNICLVSHWAVLQHLTSGEHNFENCEARWVSWERKRKRQQVPEDAIGDDTTTECVMEQHW